MGRGEISPTLALILSCSGAYSVSTMMMASEPTATVMLPPVPASAVNPWPRSVVVITVLEKSGPCCARAGAIAKSASEAAARPRIFFIAPSNAQPLLRRVLHHVLGPHFG